LFGQGLGNKRTLEQADYKNVTQPDRHAKPGALAIVFKQHIYRADDLKSAQNAKNNPLPALLGKEATSLLCHAAVINADKNSPRPIPIFGVCL